MRARRSFRVVLVAALLVACEPGPTATPSNAAVGEPTPQATAATTPAPAASIGPAPTAPPPPPPTTAAEKIVAAQLAGTIDLETAVTYRLFALFGDPRLPDDLRGVPGEDLIALDLAREAFDTLSPEGQALVRPYLVRPTHPESYWNQDPPGTEGALAAADRGTPATGARTLAFTPPNRIPGGVVTAAAPACTDGWMRTQVSANIPAMIWTQCFVSVLDAQAALEEARGYIAALWGPETALMGAPIGDRNIPNDGFEDLPETGDGLIDIYLLDEFSPSGHVRDFELGTAYAVAGSTPPVEGSPGSLRTSGYIVVRPGLRGLSLESTLAHELFHVLEYSHNKEGLVDCVLGSLLSCSADTPRDFYWMTEASATWAEHYFVPAARAEPDGPYDRFHEWRKTGMGLSRTEANNAYHSWMWPLFVQQQAGATAIGNIWRAYRGKEGFRQLQAATSSVVPFDQTLREFAVRGWNELLNPGDPLAKHYFDQALDSRFPKERPEEDRIIEGLGMDADGSGPHTEYLVIDSLATKYQPFGASGEAHTLVFDFVALAPEIDVTAIVQLEDGTWQRRDLPPGDVRWCLEKPADAIALGYLVFANHDPDPGALTRAWTWDALEEGCGTSEGGLVYSFLDTAPLISYAGGRSAIDVSVQVRLKRNEHIADPYNAMFLNDGSTYGVHTAWRIVAPPDVQGCTGGSTGTGTPGGPLEIDSVVGNTWVDEDGRNRLTLGISVPVHEEIDADWCALGTTHSSNETSVEYPPCDGIETSSTATTQTFEFDCDFQAASTSWSVSGTVVVNR